MLQYSGKTRQVGDKSSRRLRAFCVRACQEENMPILIRISDKGNDCKGLTGRPTQSSGDAIIRL